MTLKMVVVAETVPLKGAEDFDRSVCNNSLNQ